MEIGNNLIIIGPSRDNYVLKRERSSRHSSDKSPLTNDFNS